MNSRQELFNKKKYLFLINFTTFNEFLFARRTLVLITLICSASPAQQKLLKCDEYVNRVEVNEEQVYSEICTFSYAEIYEPNDIQISSAIVQDVDYESNVNVRDVSSTITTVNFVNSRLSRLPNAVFLKFHNVKTLNCDGVNLQSLAKHDISAATSLEHFSCNSNYIKSLEAMLFVNSKRLKTLDLSINMIEHIESTAFNELRELTKLLLYDNQLKVIAGDLFKDLIRLEEINLSTNQIRVLEGKLFANCKLLKYIYLTDNFIQHLTSSMLMSIDNIAFLEISNNLLTNLDLNISASALYANNNQLESIKLHSIGYLSFYNNTIKSMSFSHSEHILSLNVSSNMLNAASIQIISLLNGVKSLDLSFNNLGVLNVTTFLMLTDLQILNLQSTNLSRLEYGLFVHQTNLEQLDLSYNRLSASGTFELTKLSSLKSLEVLFIEGNGIANLDFESVLKTLPKLKTIGLSDNN
jgi:Leucine-rich repeat (LRR) protein